MVTALRALQITLSLKSICHHAYLPQVLDVQKALLKRPPSSRKVQLLRTPSLAVQGSPAAGAAPSALRNHYLRHPEISGKGILRSSDKRHTLRGPRRYEGSPVAAGPNPSLNDSICMCWATHGMVAGVGKGRC